MMMFMMMSCELRMSHRRPRQRKGSAWLESLHRNRIDDDDDDDVGDADHDGDAAMMMMMMMVMMMVMMHLKPPGPK